MAIKNIFTKTKGLIAAHKILSVIAALVLVFIGYRVFAGGGAQAETKYMLTTVARGTLISSVSGTGQVQASGQIDLKTKTAGDITYMRAVAGQSVRAGTLVAQLDASDARYDLESAKLSYDKLMTVDADALRRAENTLTAARDTLANSYTSARSSMVSALNELSTVISDLEAMIVQNNGFLRPNQNLTITAKTNRDKAESSYYDAKKSVDAFARELSGISASSNNAHIESALVSAYTAATNAAQAAKDTHDAVVYIKDHNNYNQSAAENAYTSVSGITQSANSVLSDVASARSSISNAKNSLDNAEADLEDLKNGPDELDIRSQQLSLKQKEEAVANYSITAPFAGRIASVGDVRTGDAVSSGVTIATLITDEKIAEISLNEVDAAKIAVGQKATLTFDAVEDLSISGTVAESDLVGTVSQGVVNYMVKISFDTDSDLIKPGMTVSANIIIDTKQDVLLVPASAVKTQNGVTYVETLPQTFSKTDWAQGVVSQTAPERKPVEIGATNNTMTEILSGLEDGEQIISRTVTSGASATVQTRTAPSIFGGGGGGAIRIQR